MTKNVSEIGIVITGDNRSFSRSAKKTDQDLKSLKASTAKTKVGFIDLGASVNKVGGILAAAFSVRELVQLSDEYANFTNRLKLVTDSASELAAAQRDVADIANETRQSLSGTAELYQRLNQANQTLGLSTSQLNDLTKTINQTLVISGSSAASAEAALTQLGQAFASGQLRGEEFNSVVEQAPRLAQALADGLGVGIGTLREMAKEGQLTADTVVKALSGQAEAIEAEFNKTNATVAQGFTVFVNGATEAIGKLNEITGLGSGLAGFLSDFGESLRGMADALKFVHDPTPYQRLLQLQKQQLENQARLNEISETQGNIFEGFILGQMEESVHLTKERRRIESEIAEVKKEIAGEQEKQNQAAEIAKQKAADIEENEKKIKRQLEEQLAAKKAAIKAQKTLNENLSKAASIYQSTLTPLEEYQQKIEEIDRLQVGGFFEDFGGDETAQKARDKAFQDWVDGFDDMEEKAKQSTDEMSEFAKQAARNMQDAFADFLFDPFEDGIKGLGDNFARVLQRMAAEAAASHLFSLLGESIRAASAGGTGFFPSVGQFVANAIGGAPRSVSEPVTKGRSLSVEGRKRSAQARNTTYNKTVGGDTIQNFHFHGVKDLDGFKRAEGQVAAQGARMAQRGRSYL